MNILVTGGNGQLATMIRRVVKERYLTHYADGKLVSCKGDSDNTYFFESHKRLDITIENDIEQYIRDHKIGLIINCAAYTAVDAAESVDNMVTATNINTLAPFYLAKAAKENNIGLIHISTDYVFDGKSNVPYKPFDLTMPTSVYGITKLNGEKLILSSGCGYLIIRTSWLYSEVGENFVTKMCHKLANEESVNVVTDQVGSPTYAYGLAMFIINIVEGHNMRYGIYHYADRGVASWYDLTVHIANYLSSHGGKDMADVQPCLSSAYPSKVRRPHYSVLDTSYLEQDFEYRLGYWADELDACLDKVL